MNILFRGGWCYPLRQVGVRARVCACGLGCVQRRTAPRGTAQTRLSQPACRCSRVVTLVLLLRALRACVRSYKKGMRPLWLPRRLGK